ncbi:PHD-zinc-finger like domain-containing protein [Baffinella frigidus]|nr:PHD-zinc-finger like domain-containing protein [Cryptophyta sp. CCMP2293]
MAEKCALCGLPGGALKVTACGKYHAHLACVIWIPEAHVVNTTDMRPVEIRHIPWQRQKLRCSICKNKDAPCDAPVQCYDPTCAKSFHIGCARASGEDYYIAISESAEPLAFCPKHVPEHHQTPKEKKKKGRPPRAGPAPAKLERRVIEDDPALERLLVDVEDKRVETQAKLDAKRVAQVRHPSSSASV